MKSLLFWIFFEGCFQNAYTDEKELKLQWSSEHLFILWQFKKKVLSFTMQWFNKNAFCKIRTSYDLTFFFWLYHSRWKGTNNNDNFKCMVYLQKTLWILHGRTIIYQYHPEKLLHSLWFLNVQRNNSTLCELYLCLFMNYWKNCVGVGGWVWIFVSVHDFTMD